MKQLKFGNPVFHDGLNTTVRFGRKWLELEIDEMVELTDTQGRKINEARIVLLHLCLFIDLPKWVTEAEHDPAYHDFKELYKIMKSLYDGFGPESEVVTVGFVQGEDRMVAPL